MLEKLKNLDVERIDLDEAVELSAIGRVVKDEYEKNGAEAPTWIDDRLREVRREIRARQADMIDKRLREAKARRASLKTTEEKRADLDREIAELEKIAGASA